MIKSSHSLVALAVALVACFTLGPMLGCDTPDPQGEFDRFGERTVEDRRLPDMGMEDGQQVDFSGTYVLALVTLVSTNPILLRTDVSVSADFEIDFVFQPLKSDFDPDERGERSDAREEVGAEIIANGVQLQEDGTFEVDLGTISVDEEANPISPGAIVADLVLSGSVLNSESFCGTASGQASEPTAVSLDGSTFGTVWLSMDADISEIEVSTACPAVENNINNETDMGTEPGVDECLGADDLAIIQGDDVDPSAEASSCGVANIGAADPVAESQVCIEEATGLTSECSLCYAQVVGCSIDNECGGVCAGASGSDACRECQEEGGCIAEFQECSGIVPPVVDACLGTDDLAIIEGDDVDQSAEARSCGIANISADDPVAESQVCIEAATGLSSDCSLCYAQVVGCSIDNDCGGVCIGNSEGEACLQCQEEGGCLDQFDECSGIVREEE